jgi:hypothetical protein
MMGFRATSLRLAALLPLTLLFTHTTLAQQTSQQPGQGSQETAAQKRSGNDFHSSFAASEFGTNGQVIVRGAPFVAVAISETVQVLSDGSHVTRKRTARVYRDGEGRVRVQFGRDVGKGEAYTLYDAVTGATYMVSSTRRVALQLSSPVADASIRRAKIITPQSPPEDIKTVVGETIEPLGTRIIEGVKAEGVRVTSPVPTKVGGVVYERWYSHELRRDVLIKLSDPRFGEAVYRLTDVMLTEPPADLFTIPAGYTVKPVFPQRRETAKRIKSDDRVEVQRAGSMLP